MNDCLAVYIERDVTYSIDNETIIQQFQNNKLVKGNCKVLCIRMVFFFLLFFFQFFLLKLSFY